MTPSFDCAKAHSPAEKLICSDKDLARLDHELSDAYQAALKAGAVGKAAQVDWIRSRDAKCTSADAKACVRTQMELRISELRDDADAVAAGYEPPCFDTAGKKQAAIYVRQCISISPATRPPCNVGNPCSLIIDEIKRSCLFGGGPQTWEGGLAFCKTYLPDVH